MSCGIILCGSIGFNKQLFEMLYVHDNGFIRVWSLLTTTTTRTRTRRWSGNRWPPYGRGKVCWSLVSRDVCWNGARAGYLVCVSFNRTGM